MAPAVGGAAAVWEEAEASAAAAALVVADLAPHTVAADDNSQAARKSPEVG